MSNLKVTDELLYRYMPAVDHAMIRQVESKVEKDHQFSEAFENKMKRLVRREKYAWVIAVQQYAKKIAVFLLLLTSVTLAAAMSSEANRAKFFETIRTFLGDSMQYTYEETIPSERIRYREPQYIPEGYKEVERVKDATSLTITYENQEEGLIIWNQDLASDSFVRVLDTEYDVKETKIIGETQVDLFIYFSGDIMSYFEYQESAYTLITYPLDEEEHCKIIESLF